MFVFKVIVVNFILFWKWILVFLDYIYLFKFMWFLKIEIFFFFGLKLGIFLLGVFRIIFGCSDLLGCLCDFVYSCIRGYL